MYPVLTKRAAQLRVDERYDASHGETARLQDQMERLMSRLRIAVIFGGDKAAPGSVLYKTSNTRSWKSYEAVAQDIADDFFEDKLNVVAGTRRRCQIFGIECAAQVIEGLSKAR